MGSDTTFLMEPIGTFSVLSEEEKKKRKMENIMSSDSLIPFGPVAVNSGRRILTLCSDPQLILLQFECESNFSSGLVKHPR